MNGLVVVVFVAVCVAPAAFAYRAWLTADDRDWLSVQRFSEGRRGLGAVCDRLTRGDRDGG